MALQRVINTPARGIGKTTLETLERLALETGQSTWDGTLRHPRHRLIPTRALMAIESFRQLILDAQAMMDPDFAGKLSADVARTETEDADTGFEFGSATEDLADHERQRPSGSLMPQAFRPSSRSRSAGGLGFQPHPTPIFESDAEEVAADEKGRGKAFRKPGDAATLPELIRFLLDRTGYIKALETEGSPEPSAALKT